MPCPYGVIAGLTAWQAGAQQAAPLPWLRVDVVPKFWRERVAMCKLLAKWRL
jgi:hypothetical protein